jgi:hypothetical protein
MLKIKCTRFKTNYSSFTSRSSEIYAVTVEELKKNERQGENSAHHKN